MEFMVWTGMGWEGGYNGVCDIHLAMVSFLFLFVFFCTSCLTPFRPVYGTRGSVDVMISSLTNFLSANSCSIIFVRVVLVV